MEGKSSTCIYDELESIILDGGSGPSSLPLEYLRRITNNFSDERLLGQGGFGKVYKGVLQNGKMVAVKRLDQLLKHEVQERQFQNEVFHLMRLKHPNIVRFLGYCYEIRNECVELDGKYTFAEKHQKLICLEYLPNGSLDRHLSDESSGHDWHTLYKIIKGICCGLLYLHEECQCQFGASIIHLDLKPGNILLDEYMGPKITDFGLSRLFKDNKTQIATFLSGSLGYMAPEYFMGKKVTAKADMYNLGVIIIEIIAGREVDILSLSSCSSPTLCQEFTDGVINNWRNRLGTAPSETECKQIKCCLEIGLECIKFKREERPTSREIIDILDRWETTNCNVNNEKRPPADQILTHVEEKPSVSTTFLGNESIFGAVQPNITDVRSPAGADNNRNTNTGASPRSYYGSQNRSRARRLFHRHLSRVMKFVSCVFMTRQRSRPSHYHDNNGGGFIVTCAGGSNGGGGGGGGFFGGDLYDDDYGRVAEYACCRVSSHPHSSPVGDPTQEFTFAQMEAATMGFSLEAKIGEGSFGTVYRGCLPDGREVAIKRGFQEGESFLSDVPLLSHLRHKHLIDLVGYCAENDERLLVYKYMRNGALYNHLHSKTAPSESSPSSLVMSSWKLRIRILLDASRGIEYLHSYAVPPIIHRDIKSSNILLDASWKARLSGFRLSLTESEAQVHDQNTVNVAGTVGYIDPEYYSLHNLTVKSDVYSFGVVMLEVLTGKRAILEEAEGASPVSSVVDYAVPSIVSGELGKVLDPRLPEPAAHEAEALGLVAYTSLHCVQLKGKDRPAMAGIVANLEIAFTLCEGNIDSDCEIM